MIPTPTPAPTPPPFMTDIDTNGMLFNFAQNSVQFWNSYQTQMDLVITFLLLIIVFGGAWVIFRKIRDL